MKKVRLSSLSLNPNSNNEVKIPANVSPFWKIRELPCHVLYMLVWCTNTKIGLTFVTPYHSRPGSFMSIAYYLPWRREPFNTAVDDLISMIILGALVMKNLSILQSELFVPFAGCGFHEMMRSKDNLYKQQINCILGRETMMKDFRPWLFKSQVIS